MSSVASMFEGAGITSAFILIAGLLYNKFKNMNWRVQSSCSDRVVSQATEIIEKKIQEKMEEKMNKVVSNTAKASHLGENGGNENDELPPTPPPV